MEGPGNVSLTYLSRSGGHLGHGDRVIVLYITSSGHLLNIVSLLLHGPLNMLQ